MHRSTRPPERYFVSLHTRFGGPVARSFHLCAVTPQRLVANQCPAHLLYGLWLSHSHVLVERSSFNDGGHFAETPPPPPTLLPAAGVSGREDDHLLLQLPSDWTTAFPYGTVPLSIVSCRLGSVCVRACVQGNQCIASNVYYMDCVCRFFFFFMHPSIKLCPDLSLCV